MQKGKSLRCSKTAKTQKQLYAELSGHRELIFNRCRRGGDLYLITLQLPEKNLSERRFEEKLKHAVIQFMEVVTSRLTDPTETDLDYRPVAISARDRRDRKSRKLEPTKIQPANDGIHEHILLVAHKKSRRKLIKDYKANKALYTRKGNIKVHIMRITRTPATAMGYALKGVYKRYFDVEGILIFPLTRSEVVQHRSDIESGKSSVSATDINFVDSAMSSLHKRAQNLATPEKMMEFLSWVYVAARQIDDKYGVKAGILVHKWVRNRSKSGISIPRHTYPTYSVILGAADLPRKTRSKYKRALEYITATFGYSLKRERFIEKLKLAGGVSGAVLKNRARKPKAQEPLEADARKPEPKVIVDVSAKKMSGAVSLWGKRPARRVLHHHRHYASRTTKKQISQTNP